MSVIDGLQILAFWGLILVCTPLLGEYIAAVFQRKPHWSGLVFGRAEQFCYRVGGVSEHEEMNWIKYLKAVCWFNLFGFLALFLLQVLQEYLPLNPQHLGNVPWPLAFNTAVSFTTNTNWQSYAGETTLSYLTQMVGLTTQNFLSAATGMAVLVALTRGIVRKSTDTIGNFWFDLVRSVIYILMPLSLYMALLLMTEGVVQTLSPYAEVTTVEGAAQTIPLGPVASQVAIKQLGTNGGGFFNANSSHPFENPTAFTNFLEMFAILLIPTASIYAFGIMIGAKRHAWVIFFVMLALWCCGALVSFYGEYSNDPLYNAYPVLEGKEVRLGVANSLLWTNSTSGTSNGSVNAMVSSLSPLAGGVAMFNIMLGELIFGGVGVGLCSMLMFVLLTVFMSGLMVGRTPEYFGKKIEKREVQWIVLAVLLPGALILVGASLSAVLPEALSSLSHEGPHGLSELLYAFSSTSGNNGSAFAGVNANTNYYNIVLGLMMLLGRVSIILPTLALAGLLARKNITPPSAGTFSVDTPLFAILLFGVILIVGGLTFLPALSLGPIVEHVLMYNGRDF